MWIGIFKPTKAMTMATAILIIIEGQFQIFQRFSSSKLVLRTVESCFVALNYYGNGSRILRESFHAVFYIFLWKKMDLWLQTHKSDDQDKRKLQKFFRSAYSIALLRWIMHVHLSQWRGQINSLCMTMWWTGKPQIYLLPKISPSAKPSPGNTVTVTVTDSDYFGQQQSLSEGCTSSTYEWWRTGVRRRCLWPEISPSVNLSPSNSSSTHFSLKLYLTHTHTHTHTYTYTHGHDNANTHAHTYAQARYT